MGKETKFYDVLATLMARDGEISQNELCRRTGVNQSTLQRYLAGLVTTPSIKILTPLAEYFNVTLAQLRGEIPLPHETDGQVREIAADDSTKVVLVPLLSWESVESKPTGDEPLIPALIPKGISPTDVYTLDIDYETGDFSKFDTVTVSYKEHDKSKYFVVRRRGGKRAFLAKFILEGDASWYQSLNPESPSRITDVDQAEVVGWVLAIFVREHQIFS